MGLKETFKHLKHLLEQVKSDLDKAENGNKAASQRVRTGTIRLEKAAKLYRKESIKSERNGGSKKKPAKAAAPKGKAKHGKKTASKPKKKTVSGGKPKAVKKPTAKLLKKARRGK